MKKNVFLAALVVLSAAVVFIKAESKETPNTLLLENIEALASDDEWVAGGCLGVGDLSCPRTEYKVEFIDYVTYSLSE